MSRTFVAALLLVTVGSTRTDAQTYWRVPGALGGSLVGTGVAWMLDIMKWQSTENNSFGGPSLVLTPIGLVAGGIMGYASGQRADRRLAAGDTLSPGHRLRLRFYTFLAPVAVGSAMTFAIVNPSQEAPRCVASSTDPSGCTYVYDEPAGPDEMVAAMGIGGGVVIGYWLQHRFAPALHPRVRVGAGPGGTRQYGLALAF